jgi:hypothetical protein
VANNHSSFFYILVNREIYKAFYGNQIFKEEIKMKNFFKKNGWGLCMSAAMGGLTFLLYLVGKAEGQVEAYGEVGNALQEALETVSKESTE